jgi:DNA-binding transcriptional MerR regulator
MQPPTIVDDPLTIGRFARLTGLSVGALRHYDELDLLRPAEVDRFTGYRRYAADQVEIGLAIARLRDLEVPLETLARAQAVAGDAAGARSTQERARASLVGIADPEDRELIEQDLSSLLI